MLALRAGRRRGRLRSAPGARDARRDPRTCVVHDATRHRVRLQSPRRRIAARARGPRSSTSYVGGPVRGRSAAARSTARSLRIYDLAQRVARGGVNGASSAGSRRIQLSPPAGSTTYARPPRTRRAMLGARSTPSGERVHAHAGADPTVLGQRGQVLMTRVGLRLSVPDTGSAEDEPDRARRRRCSGGGRVRISVRNASRPGEASAAAARRSSSARHWSNAVSCAPGCSGITARQSWPGGRYAATVATDAQRRAGASRPIVSWCSSLADTAGKTAFLRGPTRPRR